MTRTTRRRFRTGFVAFWRGLPRAVLFLPITLLLLPFVAVFHLANWVVHRASTRAKCGTIRITSLEDNFHPFVSAVLDALALVEKHDGRRYARLQKELRFITDTAQNSWGRYDRRFRECTFDFALVKFDWKNTDAPNYDYYRTWYVAGLAATLIHEATHGYLHSLGFPYTKRTRVQCERICVAEQRRFAARLPQSPHNFAADLVDPFNPDRWEPSWNASLLQQWSDGMKRVKERSKKARVATEAKKREPQTPPKEASVPPIFGVGKTGEIPPKPQDYPVWPKNALPAPPGAPVVEMPPCADSKLSPRPRRKRR